MVHEIKSSKKFQGFCLVGALLCEVPRQAYIHYTGRTVRMHTPTAIITRL